jgi:hypothetical protein
MLVLENDSADSGNVRFNFTSLDVGSVASFADGMLPRLLC